MGIRGYFRDLRDRLGHIENKNDDAIERLVHIEDKENELRERLIHIEQKADDLLNRNTETNTSNSTTKPGNLSYAQYGEDVLIYNVFKELGIKHPSYIDVGAHDPYIISNTAYFHEHGSRGINIEANPNLFKKFPEERPDDVNINCGAGKEEGEMSFYMIDEYSGRNSFIKENVEQFVAANPEFKIQEVRKIKIRPLNVLMKEGLEQLNEKLQNVANTGLSQQIGGGALRWIICLLTLKAWSMMPCRQST